MNLLYKFILDNLTYFKSTGAFPPISLSAFSAHTFVPTYF